jgi:hypothetical protein
VSGRGAAPEGKKELIGFQVGGRESGQSWRGFPVGLKARGLVITPEVTVGDGARGFWKVPEEVSSSARHQRCWAHKAANILPPPPADQHRPPSPSCLPDLGDVTGAALVARPRGCNGGINAKPALQLPAKQRSSTSTRASASWRP